MIYNLDGVTVVSYADDVTPYSANKNDLVIKEIEHFSEFLFQWFGFNYMKINSGKNILLSGYDNVITNIDNNTSYLKIRMNW